MVSYKVINKDEFFEELQKKRVELRKNFILLTQGIGEDIDKQSYFEWSDPLSELILRTYEVEDLHRQAKYNMQMGIEMEFRIYSDGGFGYRIQNGTVTKERKKRRKENCSGSEFIR